MPKRSGKDPNEAAFDLIQKVIARSEGAGEKNPAAVALGRLGGKKGGPARAAKLSTKKLSDIGKKGARARWGKTA